MLMNNKRIDLFLKSDKKKVLVKMKSIQIQYLSFYVSWIMIQMIILFH